MGQVIRASIGAAIALALLVVSPWAQVRQVPPVASGAAWGGITGTLSAQTDLQSALDAKAAASSIILHQATVELTDAQIKALPTTGVTVIPALASGKLPILVRAIARIVTAGGGGYTVSADASWVLMGASGGYLSSPTSISGLIETENLNRVINLPIPNGYVPLTGTFESIVSGAGSFEVGTLNGAAVIIKDDWWGVSNYTGGNAANTLRVSVTYYILNTATGVFE